MTEGESECERQKNVREVGKRKREKGRERREREDGELCRGAEKEVKIKEKKSASAFFTEETWKTFGASD